MKSIDDLYIDKAQVKKILNVGEKGVKTIVENEQWGIYRDNNKIMFLVADVKKYIEKEKYIKKNYYTRQECDELLNVSKSTFTLIYKNNNWEKNVIGNTTYFLKSDVEKYIVENNIILDKDFLSKYMTTEEVKQYLGISKMNEIYVIKGEKPLDVVFSGTKKFYLKEDVIKYKQKLKEIEDLYIETKQAAKELSISRCMLSLIARTEGWKSIQYNQTGYYLKENFWDYKNSRSLRNKKKNGYLTLKEASKYSNLSKNEFKIFVDKFNIENEGVSNKYLYNRKLIDKYIGKYMTDKKLKIEKKQIKLKRIEAKKRKFKEEENQKKEELKSSLIDKENLILMTVAAKELLIGINVFNKIIIEMQNSKFIRNIDGKRYINKDFVREIKNLQNEFWEKNCTVNEAKEKMKGYGIININRVTIPRYAKFGKYTILKCAYKNSDIEEYIKAQDLSKNNDFILRIDAINILNISEGSFAKVAKENKLEVFNKSYYKKSDILFFKEQQSYLGTDYLTSRMALEKYGDIKFVLKSKIMAFETPYFCRLRTMEKNSKLYLKADIEKILEKYKSEEIYNNITGETHYDTFLLKFDMKCEELNRLTESIYTKKKWLKHIYVILSSKKNVATKTADNIINTCLEASRNLNGLMNVYNVDEVYSLTSFEINLWFKQISGLKKRYFIYLFFEEVSNDIKLKKLKSGEYNKKFVLDKIEKYNNDSFLKKEIDKESSDGIYKYEDYLKLFRHLIKIDIHLIRIFKEFKNSKSLNLNYISTWLYLLLHLNNGWRHGDIARFPRLYMEDLIEKWEIDSLEWFEKNEITISQARRIVARIREYDFRISKTQVYGYFFCSDTLAPAIATAILLIEVFYRGSESVIAPNYDEPIMNFNNSKYNEPSKGLINKCLYESNLNNFVFYSRKMNRTLLTFIYRIVSKESKIGYDALLIPQHVRKHLNPMSTVEYISFEMEDLEFLTKELFERGEFGFIIDSLLNLIESPKSRRDRTKSIKMISSFFGGSSKLEATIGLLNYFDDEKIAINKLLKEYTYEQSLEFLTEIYLNNLPAKESGIQCLFSNIGCQEIDKKCKECIYKIPNIYLLKTIGDELVYFMDIYNNSDNTCKKIKISSKIHSNVNIILQAVRKYGRDYVYACMDIDRIEFLEKFKKIPEVESLLIQKY